ETARFGLGDPGVALAVVHRRAERLKGGFDRFFGGFDVAVDVAVVADGKRILLRNSGGVVHAASTSSTRSIWSGLIPSWLMASMADAPGLLASKRSTRAASVSVSSVSDSSLSV